MYDEVLKSFYKEYFQYLPGNFDDIYILHSNSGEAYCFLAYLAKAVIKKNNAQNPLFVATKPYHEDLISMFFPKARSIYFDMYLKERRLDILGDSWEYEGHKFLNIFTSRHFNTVNLNLGSIHYFDAMLNTLNLTPTDVVKNLPKANAKSKKEVLKIAEKIGLNLDKFVIIAPEALTTNPMSPLFWESLRRELQKLGYDVFLNATKPTTINCKTSNLSFSELFALATMAKACVSLRSGVSEFLIPTKTKNLVLCPRFHWSPSLTAEQCINAYTIMKLPFVDKKLNFELNPDSYSSEASLINHIIEIIEK